MSNTGPSRHRFAREVLGTAVTKTLALAVGLIASIVLSRTLGVDGRGLIAAVLLYPNLMLTFFEGGFRQATVLELARSSREERPVVGAVLLHFCLAAVLSVSAMLGISNLMPSIEWSGIQLLAAAALVPAGLAASLLRGLLLGRQEVAVANLVTRRSKYAYILMLIALWISGYLTVNSALIVTVLGQLSGIGIALRKLKEIGLPGPTFSIAVWWRMMKIGVIYAVALFLIDMNYRVGMVALERSGSISELGMYTVATQLAEVLWQLPTAFGFVLFAHTAAANDANLVHIERRVAESTRISLALVTGAAVILAILAPWLVPVLFGADFASTAGVIVALLPGVVAFTAFKVINTYFAGRGSPGTAIVLMAPTVVLNFILAGVLVPRYGATGAAVSASISYFVAAVAFVLTFRRASRQSIAATLVLQREDFLSLAKRLRLSQK